jgi:hypothetical protein
MLVMTHATIDKAAMPPERLLPARRAVEVGLIVLVFFVVAGDPPPNVNESHYLCRLKHFWNPAWCPGDLFLESTDTQIVFIWLYGWVTRFLSLSATAWIGRLIAWGSLAWAWQRLSWRIVPRPFASVLSAAIFVLLNIHAHLAGEWVVGGVEAKCFAYVFVVLALREVIDSRWGLVCLLLGASIAFHPIVGGWSAVLCATIWILSGRREQSFASMLPGIVAGGALALIGVVPALSLTQNESAEIVAEAARIYVFDRLPHHLAPLTLPAAEIARRFGGHAALLVALSLLTIAMRSDKNCRRILQFAWGAVFIATVGLAIEVALWNQPIVAGRLLRYYWFRLTDFAVPMAVAIVITAWIARALDEGKTWAAWTLAGALLLSSGPLAHIAILRAENPVPPADRKVVDLASWEGVCQWVAGNTPADARFLTPRLNLSFKWRAGRPEVVTRKDIPQDARGIVEWHRRLKEIYYTEIAGVETPLDSIGVLGNERVRELAKKHGADFVLMDRGQLLSLPVVFKNEEYIVYRVNEGNDQPGQ